MKSAWRIFYSEIQIYSRFHSSESCLENIICCWTKVRASYSFFSRWTFGSSEVTMAVWQYLCVWGKHVQAKVPDLFISCFLKRFGKIKDLREAYRRRRWWPTPVLFFFFFSPMGVSLLLLFFYRQSFLLLFFFTLQYCIAFAIHQLASAKSHGWRNLVGCSPWGCEESDTTERLHFHFSLSCIGEGNGNPLQCSCLENPRDGSLVGCRLWGRTESDTTDVT